MKYPLKFNQPSFTLDGSESTEGDSGFRMRAKDRTLMFDEAEEASKAISFVHSGFAITNLPYRKIDELEWVRQNGPMTLRIESGKGQDGRPLGVPYGSLARIILFYLQTEVVRTDKRTVSLGPSMYSWMNQVNISRGGRTVKALLEQATRISTCRLTFYYASEGTHITQNGAFIRTSLFSPTSQWGQVVEIDEAFFETLRKHPLPVREAAVKYLADRSLALDLYIWMCYRLNRLESPLFVSWRALHGQFGAPVQENANRGIPGATPFRWGSFRTRFADALQRAKNVYPDADVMLNSRGMTFKPSPPAVPPREVATLSAR